MVDDTQLCYVYLAILKNVRLLYFCFILQLVKYL